jgi:hypothetical protein
MTKVALSGRPLGSEELRYVGYLEGSRLARIQCTCNIREWEQLPLHKIRKSDQR